MKCDKCNNKAVRTSLTSHLCADHYFGSRDRPMNEPTKLKNFTLDCPICGETNPVIDGGYNDMNGKLNHRVFWMSAKCLEHGEYTARNARVMDMMI